MQESDPLVTPLLPVYLLLIAYFLAAWLSEKLWPAHSGPPQRPWLKTLTRYSFLLCVPFVIGILMLPLTMTPRMELTPVTRRPQLLLLTQVKLGAMSRNLVSNITANLEKTFVNYDIRRLGMQLIINRIVDASRELTGAHNWTLILIQDGDSFKNMAMGLPTGHIFISLGMMALASNGDQLAVILGHEMAHVILNHFGEVLSFTLLCVWIATAVVVASVTFVRPAISLNSFNLWVTFITMFPFLFWMFTRQIHYEADQVGTMLSARACFRVSEAVAFWRRLDIYELPEIFSSHPSHKNRALFIESLQPELERLQRSIGCPWW